MKEADRIRLLVVDCIDTSSRFSDKVLLDATGSFGRVDLGWY